MFTGRRSPAKWLFILFLLAPALIPGTASSQSSDIELSGLVLDRTITRFGKDFFFYYTSYWRDIPDTEGLTVVIHEQVYPQAGTRLWVEIEQETIFQTYFGRRHSDVKKVAEQAILISLDRVADLKARAVADSILQQLQ
ncbi:curli production assembly/transport protein CsgE [Aliidiomarina soli]|uniref:Curli production assembly/transport component CsgE n=1 Tax=Aliidiomarina soli TaxID=1928574 RepID=A0A432WIM4_9GAMM|nr:curli production assembly/transport protein CsgE [Aliidiomarina soli]RUO33618.1 curli production assembly protein CsgE [Aliidiomarina soli]